jgi:hypothetical protein
MYLDCEAQCAEAKRKVRCGSNARPTERADAPLRASLRRGVCAQAEPAEPLGDADGALSLTASGRARAVRLKGSGTKIQVAHAAAG